MPRYMLLLEENPADFSEIGPDEMQAMIEEYSAWSRRLAEQGRLHDGIKLCDEGGRRLSRDGGELRVTDGPYAEAKEVIGGLFVIEADDYDGAVEIAASCPHAERGEIVIRQIDLH